MKSGTVNERHHQKRYHQTENQVEVTASQTEEIERLMPALNAKEQKAVGNALHEIRQLRKQVHHLKRQERELNTTIEQKNGQLKLEQKQLKETARFLEAAGKEFINLIKSPVNFESEQQLRVHYFELRNNGKKLAAECREKAKSLNFFY